MGNDLAKVEKAKEGKKSMSYISLVVDRPLINLIPLHVLTFLVVYK
jgi:hypothetical protein